MSPSFEIQRNPHPLPQAERAAVLANPIFGQTRTDHQVVCVWEKGKGWVSAKLIPYGPILMDPAAAVLHYGQEIFEGIKAYRHADGSIWTFRPTENARRLQASARRMALPEVPEELFVESLRQLVTIDAAWVPDASNEKSLYIRPFEIAAEDFLGVRAAHRVEYRVIASPVGPYFAGGIKPVSIWIALDSARAGKFGTGEAKCGGNYAASLLAQTEGYEQGCSQVMFLDAETGTTIEELGGMNLFFVYRDGRVATPSLEGTILRGITRKSLVQLIKDRGLPIEERRITLAELSAGLKSGDITEVFACGTAAVITPVGQFKSRQETLGSAEAQPGPLTLSLREELTGIQTGRVPDRHGWMYRLV
ncbi:MAG TPA: branched-chain amino acid aminotransferase [Burkholderiaceae bacterium]|jgi:branched-chain amino acid aminotransferase|nr:branched-chain amino acid aminotransferase [Burkholderiaceae bacterium]